MRKLCSHWVPRMISADQKQQIIDNSKRCLELFKGNKHDYLSRNVTMDETWIHYYTPESKGLTADCQKESSSWLKPS
ncbi:histone-lysine N-methyltransferase SETMAR [Trichonephila clavipes]|nr:histone-lysine N-methyltransferase SETMAR [Trichonephila clavipes]